MDSTLRSDLIDQSPAPSLGRSTLLQAVRSGKFGGLSPGVAALVTVVLLLSTVYVGWAVRSAMRSLLRDSVGSVLAANVAGLELWLSDQTDEVNRLATDPRIEPWLIDAVDKTRSKSDTAENDGQPSRDLLDIATRRRGYVGWAVLNPAGMVLHSNLDAAIGTTFELPRDILAKLDQGDAAVTRPLEAKISTKPSQAIMCAVAPVGNSLVRRGTLALIIDPGKQFTRILTVARIGTSGETYAIDSQAVLLSRSRFESQLRVGGLLDKTQASPLNIVVRDPGVDIREHPLSDANPQSWPMTLMADHVIRGGNGYNVVGYNDYRGVPVIGAWQWMPEYSIGVATELDVDEAYAPLSIFRNAFFALVSLIVIACGSLIGLAWVLRRLDKSRAAAMSISRRIGQYELKHAVGRGGMGKVYVAEHRILRRDVAIKLLEHTEVNERTLARFQREVRLTAKLQHPNTIDIYDFGQTEDQTFFYVMELVDGISLQQLIDYYGRQPPERVIYLLTQICGSIAEAHDQGMIHRDIKPANVLITSRAGLFDLVKVVDFGLAKRVDAETMQLTITESLTGTPLYMSPESVRDASTASTRSDIYSIGSVGYMLLTAMTPFEGDSSAEICAKKLNEDPIDPRLRLDVNFPADLVRILMKCLSRDPNERPETVEQLGSRLLKCKHAELWAQQDAALWWKQVFDGPMLSDMAALAEKDAGPKSGTKGDTAINAEPVVSPIADGEPTPRA